MKEQVLDGGGGGGRGRGSGGQTHAPASFPPEQSPGTQCTQGWLGPSHGLGKVGEEKISFSHRSSNPEASRL
jgi:hypothetical protein